MIKRIPKEAIEGRPLLERVDGFLFGKNVQDDKNRSWLAYLAIRERIKWPYSMSLEDIKVYNLASVNYYYRHPESNEQA